MISFKGKKTSPRGAVARDPIITLEDVVPLQIFRENHEGAGCEIRLVKSEGDKNRVFEVAQVGLGATGFACWISNPGQIFR